MNLIEIYTDGLCESIGSVSESKLNEAVRAGVEILNGTATEEDFSSFYNVASYIVEPEIEDSDALDEYFDYMDTDKENWQSYIEQNFGSEWGMIAKIVAEYGY